MSIYGIYFKDHIVSEIHHKFDNLNLNLDSYKLTKGSSTVVVKGLQKILLNTNNFVDDKLMFGSIFSKSQSSKEISIPTKDGAEFLNDNYWGSYVFLKISEYNFEIFVSQSSSLQVFYCASKEYVVFSSDIVFINKFIQISFDEEYLKAFLIHGDFISSFTPFKKVMEVCGGYKVNFNIKDITESKIWNYNRHTQLTLLSSEAIPQTLSLVVGSVSENFNNIFLDLSGGLDSSSILFSLNHARKQNQKIYGINISDEFVKSSNEIQYVESLKEVIDFELIKINYNDCLPFTTLENYNIVPSRPSIVMSHLKKDQMLNEIAKSYTNNPLFINGHVGDALFLCPPPIECISDMIIDGKFSSITKKIMDLALYYRKPLLDIVVMNLKSLLKSFFKIKPEAGYYSLAPWYNFSCKVNKKYISLLYECLDSKMLPGEIDRLIGLYFALSSIKSETRNSLYPVFYPFSSQPMLEIGLGIKTYDSFNEGYDRYVFRKSISDYFKTELVWRKSKGNTTGVFHKGLRTNKEYILNLCMDGYLSKMGIIDKKILLKYYESISGGFMDYQWQFNHLLCLEIYMAMWRGIL